MTKKAVLAILLVLVISGAALAFNPYGFARYELEKREPFINSSLNSFGINPTVIDNIIWTYQSGVGYTDIYQDDGYVWWRNIPGEVISFCVGCNKTGNDAYVALVKDQSPNSIGFAFVIDGQYTVQIDANWSFQQMFDAVRAVLMQVGGTGYKDSWTYTALKMLLEILQQIFP